MKRSTLFFGFGFLALILVLSCSKDGNGPDNNTVTVSGKVTLEGVSDYSGVTVSLYNLVALNPEIAAINQQYPTIGVKISQETEFDHREQMAAYSVTTNANGDWRIENVPSGIYHIVVQKNEFGWQYLLDYSSLTNPIHISLARVITLQGIIDSSIVINYPTTILVNGNVQFGINSNLVFNEDVNVLFGKNARIDLYGTFAAVKSVVMTSQNLAESEWGKGIVFHSDNINVENMKFTKLKDPLLFTTVENINVKNCYFSDVQIALEFFDSRSLTVSSNLFYNSDQGLKYQNSVLDINKNIFLKMALSGIDSKNDQGSMIKNNLLSDIQDAALKMNVGGYSYDSSYASINYNDFRNNKTNIYVRDKGYPICNFNNLFNTTFYNVICDGVFTYTDTLNFRENYWELTLPTEIEEKIFDRNDKPNGYNMFIDFSGYRFDKINW